MNLTGSKKPTQILGLTLDHGRLEGVLLKRTNGSLDVLKTLSVPLTLDPLRNEAELVGREIRNLLDAADVREKRVVVGVPAGWTLTLHTGLTGIEEADLEGYLQIEAERGFPRNPEELVIAVSRQKSGGGNPYAMQIAVPRDYVGRLEQILEAAQLKALSFSPAITALGDGIPAGNDGRISVIVEESGIELMAASGGGITSLRRLDGFLDEEGSEKRVQTELFARELRITLRQMPEDLRENLKQLFITGPGRMPRQVADELQAKAGAFGLSVVLDSGTVSTLHGLKLSPALNNTPSLWLAARYLAGQDGAFEFLPPKPSLWQQWSERYSARRLAWAGAAAAALLVISGGAFAYQQAQLSSLRSQWNGMKSRVADVEELQSRVRKFRPWYNESVASLAILKKVTEAFPEEGSVSAKTFEVHNQGVVSVTGTARDHASLLRALDRLRASKEVGNVQVDQIRGKSPMQFTFNFSWGTGVVQ